MSQLRVIHFITQPFCLWELHFSWSVLLQVQSNIHIICSVPFDACLLFEPKDLCNLADRPNQLKLRKRAKCCFPGNLKCQACLFACDCLIWLRSPIRLQRNQKCTHIAHGTDDQFLIAWGRFLKVEYVRDHIFQGDACVRVFWLPWGSYVLLPLGVYRL